MESGSVLPSLHYGQPRHQPGRRQACCTPLHCTLLFLFFSFAPSETFRADLSPRPLSVAGHSPSSSSPAQRPIEFRLRLFSHQASHKQAKQQATKHGTRHPVPIPSCTGKPVSRLSSRSGQAPLPFALYLYRTAHRSGKLRSFPAHVS